jgi:hypothetical protein
VRDQDVDIEPKKLLGQRGQAVTPPPIETR